MGRKNNILFVQIEHFHGEVLTPQLELLEGDYELSLFGAPGLNADDIVSSYNITMYDAATFNIADAPRILRKIISLIIYLLNLLKLRILVGKLPADLIVFNTIPSVFKLRLIRLLFNGKKKIVIIHNAEKYLPRYKLLSCFDKVLFLSEEVYSYCREHTNKIIDKKLDYFVPVSFDKFLKNNAVVNTVNDSRIILGIIGKTDFSKRDYSSLLKTLVKYRGMRLNFRIIISGQVLNSFVDEIRQYDLEHIVTYTRGYKTFSSLFSDIISSDILLFLINKNVQFFDKYNKVKISGTTNMAKAFCKPVAYSKDFKVGEYLSSMSMSYDNLEDLLDQIQSGKLTKKDIQAMADDERCRKYKEYQAKHYRSMIKSLLFD